MNYVVDYLAAMTGADGGYGGNRPGTQDRLRREYLRSKMLHDFEDRIEKLEARVGTSTRIEFVDPDHKTYSQVDLDKAGDAKVKADRERIWRDVCVAVGHTGKWDDDIRCQPLYKIINNEAEPTKDV